MIRTQYDVVLEIDDKPFSVVVRDITKKQSEELSVLTEAHDKHMLTKKPLQAELEEAIEEFEVNKLILKEEGLIGKLKLALEQKALIKKISKLSKEMQKINESAISTTQTIAEVYSKRFDIQVSGADKSALKKEIEDKEIPFSVVFESLEKLAREAVEKK